MSQLPAYHGHLSAPPQDSSGPMRTMLRYPPLALLALLIALSPLSPSATAQPPTPANSDAELVSINMRDADIRAVIQWIAEQTHQQIVIDPRVQGQVSVLADKPMTIDQAYQVFLAMLDVNGYAASESDGILRIYPSPLAKTSPRELVEDFTRYEGGGQVMHVLQLQYVSATALAQTLQPLVSGTGLVAPQTESNSLLLADNASTVKRLVELARRMDSRGSLDIDVVKLRHAGAREIAAVLATLVQPASGSAAAGQSPLTVAADERSNSILVTGDPASRRRARQLLQQLDQPIGSAGLTRVIYLHYMDAEELVPILQGMVGSVQEDAKDEETRQAAISIEASKSTNALVLTGAPDLLDNMEQVIAKLDIRRAQVLVEAVIVEVSQDLGSRLGVEWNTSFDGSGVEAATGFGGRPRVDGSNPNILSLLSNGLTLGYYRGGSLRALINALATTSEANILSTPSLLTLDNQEAQILVGSNIPVITGRVTGEAASVDNPFTTIERQDIGVTLRIRPQINAGDAVTLDILQEVETIADAASLAISAGLDNVQDIVTNKRSIATKVLVPDDSVLVLGGLIATESSESVSKVPVLGDMPLVGRLFRSTTTRSNKRNLMVFIRPLIVDDEAVAESLTRGAYDGMRSQQLKYQDGKFSRAGTPATLPEFDEFRPRTKTPIAPIETESRAVPDIP